MLYLSEAVLCVISVGVVYTSNVQFTQFQQQPGIYFDEVGRADLSRSDWKMVLYYNLTNYWQEWSGIKQAADHLQDWCNQLNVTRCQYQNCMQMIGQVNLLIANINERQALLRDTVTRKRRAPLEFVGNLMNDIFGVLDQRDASKYYQQIQELSNGQMQVQQLIKQHTHILDITTNLIQKEEANITAQYQAVQQDFLAIQHHGEMTDAVLQLTMATSMFKEIQTALIEVMIDVHHGQMNTRLLTPSQLGYQLQQVQSMIPSSMRIPVDQQHWVQWYKLLRVNARVWYDQMIFEVKIPLLTMDEFQLYNAIPLPTRHQGKFIYIEPHAPYLLIDIQRTWFYPLSSEELSKCLNWDGQTYLCRQNQPLYTMKSDMMECEMALLDHEIELPQHCIVKSMLPQIYVKQLIKSNSWILVLEHETVFDVVCSKDIETVKLNGSGILTLKPRCLMKNKKILIASHTTYTTYRNVYYLPKFNLSQHVVEKDVRVISAGLNPDLQLLEDAMNKLHAEEPWQRLTVHDVSQYSIAGIGVVVLVCVAAICFKKLATLRKTWREYIAGSKRMSFDTGIPPIAAPRRKLSA